MLFSQLTIRALSLIFFGLLHLNLHIQVNARFDSVLQFDPTGTIRHLENTQKIIKDKGGPIIAIRGSDGIILVTARPRNKSKLIVSQPQKLFFLDDGICIAISGAVFQAEAMVNLAKAKCADYMDTYGIRIPLEILCSHLSDIFHAASHSKSGFSNAISVSMVIAGVDEKLGPQIYTVEPDGRFNGWNAVAVGENSDKVMQHFLISNHDSGLILDGSVTVGELLTPLKRCIIDCLTSKSDDNSVENTFIGNGKWDVGLYIGHVMRSCLRWCKI